MAANGNEIEAWKLYIIMFLMLVFGTFNTVVIKTQDEVVVGKDDQGHDLHFNHPFFQGLNMFVGELTCLLVYFGKRMCSKPKTDEDDDETPALPASPGTQMAKKTEMKTSINPLLLAIPATFDLCGSTTMFIGLTQCASSIYQMMRGFIVVITAVLAVIFLGRKQYLHHVMSLVFIVIAVALVGVVGIVSSKNADPDPEGGSTEATTTVLGVTLVLVAQFFTGGQFITEEKLLSGYYLDPLLVVGLEGLWGTLWYCLLLPIFQHVTCTADVCQYGVIEDTKAVFREMGEHHELIWYSLGIVVSIACFNATGVAVTKYASAPQRSTIDTCRTLFVWIVAILQGTERWLWSEAGAFVLLVGATLVYNEIWVLPCDQCNKNTKKKITEREGEDGLLDDPNNIINSKRTDLDYVATSPHAAYDSNRNIRGMKGKMEERSDLLKQHNAQDNVATGGVYMD